MTLNLEPSQHAKLVKVYADSPRNTTRLLTCDEKDQFCSLLKNFIKKKLLQYQETKKQNKPILKNNFPSPSTLVLEILTRCNFNCRHCYLGNRLKSNDLINQNTIEKLFKEAKFLKINRIQITGGNPSLHPEILSILNLSREYGFEVIFFTNGVGLNKKILQTLEKGNVSLHISIYGMSNKTGEYLTRCKNYFDKVMSSIRNVKKLDIRIRSLDYMATEKNIKEIDKFINFCNTENLSYRLDSPANVGCARLNKIKNVRKKILNIPQNFDSFEFSTSLRKNSCAFDQPTILANGDVTFCILANLNFPDLILGNIYEKKLSKIWYSNKSKEIYESTNVNNNEICKSCEYKYLCGGTCPFSRKFHYLSLRKDGLPNCRVFHNKNYQTWK